VLIEAVEKPVDSFCLEYSLARGKWLSIHHFRTLGEGEQVFHRKGTQVTHKLQGFDPASNRFVGHEGQKRDVLFGKRT